MRSFTLFTSVFVLSAFVQAAPVDLPVPGLGNLVNLGNAGKAGDIGKLTGKVGQAVGGIVSGVSGASSAIGGVTGQVTHIESAAKDMAEPVIGDAESAVETAKKEVQPIVGDAKSTVSTVIGKVEPVIQKMTNGERLARGLPPASPASFIKRTFGGLISRYVPSSERIQVRSPAPSSIPRR